jgi:hypothetical protein
MKGKPQLLQHVSIARRIGFKVIMSTRIFGWQPCSNETELLGNLRFIQVAP